MLDPELLHDPELLKKVDAYWRSANYLSVGQLYLRNNPLLRRPLEMTDVKHEGGELGYSLSHSFGAVFARTIQQPAMKIRSGKATSVEATALSHRAECNRAARHGVYTKTLETTVVELMRGEA